MKRVTASDARKNWFRLLDEVVAGAIVRIERGGAVILLQRAGGTEAEDASFDYSSVLRVPQPEVANEWGWEWTDAGLEPRDVDPEEGEP